VSDDGDVAPLRIGDVRPSWFRRGALCRRKHLSSIAGGQRAAGRRVCGSSPSTKLRMRTASRYDRDMPLFEYECRSCGRSFEYLTREGQSPSCPACQSVNLQKLLSVFAVSAQSGSGDRSPFPAAGGPCGSCGDPRGPGSCSMN
jgi:putative FmdB family regulatory protein